LNVFHERLDVPGQDGAVDVVERLFGGKRHVEDGEERDESRVDVVSAAARSPHRRHPAEVSQPPPVEVLAAIVAAAAFQQQFEQRYRLLSAVLVNLASTHRRQTLGVVEVGPRCRPLASAGKVSAAKATDPKLDNL